MFSTIRKSLLSLALVAAVAVAAFAPPAQAGSLSNFLANKLIDFTLRGQAFTPVTTVFVALATTTGSPAACGTEVSASGTGYARVAITSSLTSWSGTQGAGSTAVSSGANSGTGLVFSNNAAITFGTPTANWGTVVEVCVFDSAVVGAGNLLFRQPLTTSQVINNGATAPSFAIGTLTGTVN